MSFNDTFLEHAIVPWRDASPEFPWLATPELRSKWLDLISSNDETLSLTGALALSRCLHLTEVERLAIETFFSSYDGTPLDHNQTLAILLSGATLPHFYTSRSITARFTPEGSSQKDVLFLFCDYLRHPDTVRLSALGHVPTHPAIDFAVLANPLNLSIPDTGFFEKGLLYFKGVLPWSHGLTDFYRFASIVGVSPSRDAIQRELHLRTLPSPFLDCLENHPALNNKFPSLSRIQNPSFSDIDSLSGSSPAAEILHAFHPLFRFPWDPPIREFSPVTLPGRAIFGQISTSSSQISTEVYTLLQSHPFSLD